MAILGWLKERFGSGGQEEEASGLFFVYVKIPEDIQPIARGEKYEDPLQARLDAKGLGEITGGGSQLGDNHPDGTPSVEFCGLDLDLTEPDEGLSLLRVALPELGAPVGTELHYTVGDAKLQDVLCDDGWVERQPRTLLHPGFGV